jgi:hypothetical protein
MQQDHDRGEGHRGAAVQVEEGLRLVGVVLLLLVLLRLRLRDCRGRRRRTRASSIVAAVQVFLVASLFGRHAAAAAARGRSILFHFPGWIKERVRERCVLSPRLFWGESVLPMENKKSRDDERVVDICDHNGIDNPSFFLSIAAFSPRPLARS